MGLVTLCTSVVFRVTILLHVHLFVIETTLIQSTPIAICSIFFLLVHRMCINKN